MWPDWLSSARSDEDEPESVEARRLRLRRYRKWAVFGVVGIVFVVGGGATLYRFGGNWLERRNRENLRGYLEQQDYRRAQLALEQAVQVSPQSVSARRALAEFYEAAGSPVAVDRWREAVALAPNDDEIRLRLAGSALRLEGPNAAAVVLKDLSPAGRATLGYHRVAAGIALTEGKPAELEDHLRVMAEFEPDNARTKISLASLRLLSADTGVAAAARTELEQSARGETARIHTTLALLLDATRRNDSAPLRHLAERLFPGRTWNSETAAGIALVEHMKAESHPSADDAGALGEWLVARGMARETLVWLGTQPVATQAAPAVLAARANAAVQLRDWNLLRQLVGDGAWGRVSRDAVELAFAARLQRERAGLANAKETFGDAIELGASSPSTLKALNRLCVVWGWADESERVLTRLVHDFPREQFAWAELLAKAEAGGKSARFVDLAGRRAVALPGDASAQALALYAAAVIAPANADVRKAAEAALANENALGEALAAGVLLRWRDTSAAEALGVLSPHQIETLSRSRKGTLILGAASAAAGKKGSEFLARVSLENLLPEEKALLPRRGK